VRRTIRPCPLLLVGAVWATTVLAGVGLAGAGATMSGIDASAPPIEIEGCWTGAVSSDSQGNDSITFVFDQNGTKIRRGPRVAVGSCASRCGSSVRIGDNVTVLSPIGGTVDSTGFTFDGHFRFPLPMSFRGPRLECRIIGQGGLQNDGSIAGSYSYAGKCGEQGFVGGDFSLTPSQSCN
jgi:hypothetical protein